MTDRDHITLAREVLAIQFRHQVLNGRTGLDLPIDINDMDAMATAAPDLANAIIDLTAERDAYVEENTRLREQLSRVRALADRLDAEADRIGTSGGGTTVSAFAAEIRAALNGDTNE